MELFLNFIKDFSIFVIYIHKRNKGGSTVELRAVLHTAMTKDQTIKFAIDKLMDNGYITMATNPLTNYMKVQISDLYDKMYDRYGRVSATALAEELVSYRTKQENNRAKADRKAARNERRNRYAR